MNVDLNSAEIDVDVTDSQPSTDISSDGAWASLHLTRNSDPVIEGSRTTSDRDASAITITGSVDVTPLRNENLSNWTFRFIQFVADMNSYTRYLGRVDNDGFMSVNLSPPPIVPQRFAYEFNLDSAPEIFGPQVMPFTNLRVHNAFPKVDLRTGRPVPGTFNVVNDMDDHPSRRMKVAFQNRRTRATNYLAEAQATKLFLTAFVAFENQTRKITPLAYVPWKVEWNMKYRWSNGRCIPYDKKGTLEIGKMVRGTPTQDIHGRKGSYFAAKIISPSTDPNETANTISRTAIRSLGQQTEFWNLNFGTKLPPDIPPAFWAR